MYVYYYTALLLLLLLSLLVLRLLLLVSLLLLLFTYFHCAYIACVPTCKKGKPGHRILHMDVFTCVGVFIPIQHQG